MIEAQRNIWNQTRKQRVYNDPNELNTKYKAVYDNTNLKLSRSSADVDAEVGRVHPYPSFDDCCASDSQ